MKTSELLQELGRRYTQENRLYFERYRILQEKKAEHRVGSYEGFEHPETAKAYADVMEAVGARRAIQKLAMDVIAKSGRHYSQMERVYYAAMREPEAETS